MAAILVRALGAGTANVRTDTDTGRAGRPVSEWDPHPGASTPLLTGQFARFDEWTEINSHAEGSFMERIAPGAFQATLRRDRSRMRILYDHGQDPQIGNKPLAAVELLGEDPRGAFYGGYLFPVEYALQLVPALRAGQLGSSFRFSVEREHRIERPQRSEYNPERLPERTITEARVYEFGPVTWPAYQNATAGVRSYQRSRDGESAAEWLRQRSTMTSADLVRRLTAPHRDTPAERIARERWLDRVAPLPARR